MNLVLLSGGIDSTTALFWSKQQTHTHALILEYGSRHNAMEVQKAVALCKAHNIAFTRLDIHALFANFQSALLQNSSDSIPKENYNTHSLQKLVIPFRNGIFISVAAGLAQSMGYKEVVLANHAGDHPLYPDCTSSFIDSMRKTVLVGSGGLVNLCSPFCSFDKAEIVKIGIKLGIDYSQTYSCYEGGKTHCNVCPTCIESNEAFRANGIVVTR